MYTIIMFKRLTASFTLLALTAAVAGRIVIAGSETSTPDTSRPSAPRPLYEYREPHDPNGIGKFYMGREIAQVMGHLAADWLDRPEREQEEQPAKLLEALQLKPGDVVADIGAGTGYFSFRLAERVGPQGKVFATDIQPEMLDIIRQRMKERTVSNIEPVLGTITDPGLPANAVDLILLVDVYHEFDHPYEMTVGMVRALKPGGRLVFVEYRLEDPKVPIKLVHKMSEQQVCKEMAPHPLRWLKTSDVLPWQHIIIFEKQRPKKQSSR
ncbi:MAG: class I SAM-dependent methyltransferase [Armatimonadota bacterium]|nr:class I SAM-dependent methyltransferase [Armatimonadota bacterium]